MCVSPNLTVIKEGILLTLTPFPALTSPASPKVFPVLSSASICTEHALDGLMVYITGALLQTQACFSCAGYRSTFSFLDKSEVISYMNKWMIEVMNEE